jgi:hypothetical protein
MNEFHQPKISVIDPVNDAFNRVKLLLFEPFEMKKWFVIGFCAWLATLGKGGGGGGGNYSNTPGGGNFDEFKNVIINHLPVVIIVGTIIILFILAITLLVLWLSSRGKFMFLHCIANNKAEVKVPWHKYRSEANSLFVFRFAAGIIAFIVIALLVGTVIFGVVLLGGSGGQMGFIGIPAIVVSILFLIPIAIAIAVFFKFINDFVVPIMYINRCTCTEGLGQFWELLKLNKWNFTLYVLFQILIGIVISTIIIAVVCMTCCIAGCLMVIPYIGTVVLLPVLVFARSYSLYYFGQYGRSYNVFMFSEELPDEGSIQPEPGQ